jgi:hypothetical protein
MLYRGTVFACFLSCAVLTPSAISAQEVSTQEGDVPLTTDSIEESIGRDENWADESHEYVGNKADDLAIYLDRFFGAPLEDLESADSTVRLSAGYRWDKDRGNDTKFRLRGNVHLPRINDRLSLVFNGEEDEDGGSYASAEDTSQAGLQFKASETETGRSRFDLTLSVSSGVNLKPGIRYRFKNDLGERSRFRYTGRAFYSDRDRFQHKHLIDLDYQTGETSLIRWSNRMARGDRTEGTEWRSQLSWRYGYSLDSAVAFVLLVSGQTDPDAPEDVGEGTEWPPLPSDDGSLVTNYGAVIKLRNRLYKDWLFIEFEPGYTNRQRHHYDERHGVFFGKINFEILFNRGRKGKAKEDEQEVAVVLP